MLIEKTITVKELNELYNNGFEVEIDTPDGYQSISSWYNKGFLPMCEISTENHTTVCAKNHLIQLSNGEWKLAGDLIIGDIVFTQNGNNPVTNVSYKEDAECFDFTVDHPNHRYWGDGFSSHNSGKSYICSGNIVKDAQNQGIFCVIIDSENAIDEAWLKNLGVDTDESKLMRLSMSMIDDVAKAISTFTTQYKAMPVEDRPKVLFVIDSLGMLLTPTDVNQFEAGDMKGDLGRKAKNLTALIRNCCNMFGSLNIGMVCTNHTYASQDQYDPDQRIAGGGGAIFAASIVVAMKKLKLKEDENGEKSKEVLGIRAGCKIMKTRYNQPFQTIEVKIPYDTGMDPYSGLFDMLEERALVTKEGNRYVYTDLAKKEHKYFRKEWNNNSNGILDLVMKEFSEKELLSIPEPTLKYDPETGEILG